MGGTVALFVFYNRRGSTTSEEATQEAKPARILTLPEEPHRRTAKGNFVRRRMQAVWRWMAIETGKDWLSLLTPLSAVIATIMVGYFAASINQTLQQETAMQTYLDQTTGLLLKDQDSQLHQLTPDDNAQALLNSRTTLLLERLSPERSSRLVRYLARADLLPDVSIAGADLRGADLSDQNLCGADLREADLTAADLSNAYLRDAYLNDANLSNANMRGTDLSGADLSGAEGLAREQLAQAKSFEGADVDLYRLPNEAF